MHLTAHACNSACAAARMKASAAALDNGDSMILTLADADILTEEGTLAEDTDVLENYDAKFQEDIDKAKRCAASRHAFTTR